QTRLGMTATFSYPVVSGRPRAPLFPYTTLFRSVAGRLSGQARVQGPTSRPGFSAELSLENGGVQQVQGVSAQLEARSTGSRITRSEEHTSELQSRENLVCRLLLEKQRAGNGGGA